MDNILCKIGLHKWRKVKSTETDILKIMEDIIRAESKILLPINSEEIMCRKFGINRNHLWIGYDLYDYVCIRPGCNCCDYRVDIKRNELIEKRNQIISTKIETKSKDRKIEDIYKGCKNE